MNNNIFRHLSGGILALFLVLFCPMSVLAETVPEENSEIAAGGVTRTAADTTTREVTKDGVTFKVTYPSDISCGTPVTFQFETVDASGNEMTDVKYRIHSLLVWDGAENVSVYDVSYGSNSALSANKTWNFTFYASGTYYIRFNNSFNNGSASIDTGLLGYGIVLTINDPSYPSVEEIVKNIAAECESKCTNDFDKAVWLNDWLVDHCRYDYSGSYCSAEGALARGTGTCEAYHRAYEMLLNKVGIATGRITGNGHVWTAVKLDGKWYQVDTTWNDAGYEDANVDLKHLYFGLNDAITSLVHSDHKPVSGYVSDSLDNNYFIKTGSIVKWADPQIQAVQQHIDAGETAFSLEIKNTNGAYVLYSVVAHVLTNESWTANGNKVTLKAEYCPNYLDSGAIDKFNGTISCQVQSSTDTGGSGSSSGGGSTGSGGNSSGSGSSGGGSTGSSGSGSTGGGGNSSGSGSTGGGGSSSGGGSAGSGGSSGGSGSAGGGAVSGGSSAVGGGSIVGGWIDSGIKNGRQGIAVYRGVDYSSVYNFEYYITRYPDIKSVFGNDERAALNHFINFGIKEGRSAQENFDVYFYRSSYPDLETAFGDDLASYFYHYINFGMKEGRMGIPQQGTKA